MVLAVVVGWLGVSSMAWANPARGYNERPCGFDLDDDGEVGEPLDDCRVCDGSTTDPDGDGVDEDLIYVDCDSGSDAAGCGAPGSPCGSVAYALQSRMDGPGDGAEDIVCFTGTCAPRGVTPAFGGLTDVRTVPQSGSEARDFEIATNPAMLVGWDTDADGEYPPYDADDVAVLDGTGGVQAFTLQNSSASHFEFAHFTAQEYGRTGNSGGFFQQGTTHTYLHDLSLQNICREMPTPSGRIVFNFFSSQNTHFFWVKNIECEHCGGYFIRGAGGNGPQEAGPFRFQGISLNMHGCDYGSSPECDAQPYTTLLKLWGYIDGVEVLDSSFDGDPTNRVLGNHPSHWPVGVLPANCSENYTVRNNTFIDMNGLNVQGYAAGFCDGPEARPTDAVLFENNLVEFAELDKTANATVAHPIGNVADADVGYVEIRNNIFRSTPNGGMADCFAYNAGNSVAPPDGQLVFEDNRCEGASRSAIRILDSGGMLHQSYAISNKRLRRRGDVRPGRLRALGVHVRQQHLRRIGQLHVAGRPEHRLPRLPGGVGQQHEQHVLRGQELRPRHRVR